MVFTLPGRISWPSTWSFQKSRLSSRDKGTPESDEVDEPLLQTTDSHGDSVSETERVKLTEEDNKRICRKTDLNILPILVWVYFLQILDKTTLGYAAIFDLERDTGLTGRQYSLIGSIAPFAQLLWQPFSSWLIVKVPHKILVSALVLGWGVSQASMAACNNFTGLMITRFLLGLFEAGCLPVFSVITSQWYRRQEQPIRVAAWYSTNGISNVVAAGLAFSLGHIKSDLLLPWQTIFLFVGLVTIATAPLVYWRLPNGIASAPFFDKHEKTQAIERLRANQTGTGSREFRLEQVTELLIEPKTWLFITMTMLLNIGTQVTSVFGPLILAGFGFDKYATTLLNMPFGILQFIAIMFGSWATLRFRFKSLVLASMMVPVTIGIALLYFLPRTGDHASLMASFYLLSFMFAGNPLIVSWIVGNTAGTTKKSVIMSLYNAGSAGGNIIGPLLFKSRDAPSYQPGLRAVLAIFIALLVVVFLQLANLVGLNRLQQKRRVANGKMAVIHDHSMDDRYVPAEEGNDEEEGAKLRDAALRDLTDRQNDEFTYIY
ncbi:MFS transporter ACS family allantoate permease [Venturia nashicola]|uniref:MFS transporter n=1 Tax=Venturia nashicola TaxID=86259 RepID=A0A4Z1NWC5_9PEZI|nr:MFS transporter [Venturia nashicola]TLD29608.1 MFS transporter ACS family allantoate permease [Venturia nashicola]